MLDLRFIKDNIDAVKANIAARNMQADPDLVVRLYDERNAAIQTLEGKRLKDEIAALEADSTMIEKELAEAAARIPNMALPDATVGKVDTKNLEVKQVGTPAQGKPAHTHGRPVPLFQAGSRFGRAILQGPVPGSPVHQA
jgi:seryl-tRNA synthetase